MTTMEFLRDQAHRLQFDFDCDGPEALNCCAFIVLVATRYDGKIQSPVNFLNGADQRRGWVMVAFDGLDSATQAESHCRGFLDSDGSVRRSYLGALENVDRGLRQAGALLKKVRKKR